MRKPSGVSAWFKTCSAIVASRLWGLRHSQRCSIVCRWVFAHWRSRSVPAKTEFNKFGESLSAVKEKIDQASRKMEDVDVRSRAITKKLRDVEELPSNPQPLLKDFLQTESA